MEACASHDHHLLDLFFVHGIGGSYAVNNNNHALCG